MKSFNVITTNERRGSLLFISIKVFKQFNFCSPCDAKRRKTRSSTRTFTVLHNVFQNLINFGEAPFACNIRKFYCKRFKYFFFHSELSLQSCYCTVLLCNIIKASNFFFIVNTRVLLKLRDERKRKVIKNSSRSIFYYFSFVFSDGSRFYDLHVFESRAGV